MKRVILFLIGFAPLLFGYLLFLMDDHIPLLLLINIAAPIIWGFVASRSITFVDNKIESILIINAPVFIALLLLLYQEIILGRYFNIIGTWTQAFCFPIVLLRAWFDNIIIFYIAAFLLLFAATYIGRTIGERRKYKA